MKKLTVNPERYKKKPSKHKERWQAIAEEMSSWFSKPCYYIFHKERLSFIEDSFRICKEKEIHNLNYFWAIINNRKKL